MSLPRFSLFLTISLLFVLTLRLTQTEVLFDSLSGHLSALANPHSELSAIPNPGPTTVVAFCVLTLLLTSAVLFTHRLTRFTGFFLALITVILTLACVSTFHAAAPFAALVGTCDLATALLSGFSLTLILLSPSTSSDERKRHLTWIYAVMAGLLTLSVAKALHQHFVDIPDTIEFYQANKEQIWAARGWSADDASRKLFEARMLSRELTGYLTFSNIFTSVMIPLILIPLGVGMGAFFSPKPAVVAKKAQGSEEIPPAVLGGFLLVPVVAGAGVLLLSDSKGAVVTFALCLLALVAAFFFRRFFATYRRQLALGAVLLTLLTAGIVVGYGVAHHGLPSKSLLYRWQYWTGAANMMADRMQGDFGLLGVGLNNFGNYYTAHKLPSSPEDVKDPHSFFVRIAAEMGFPAVIFIGVLIGVLFLRPVLASAAVTSVSSDSASSAPVQGRLSADLVLGAIFFFLWFLGHVYLAEVLNAYTIPITFFFALFAFLICALTHLLLAKAYMPRTATEISPLAAIPFVALLSAAGMFIYDQINMALVTGSGAMLFYVLLATGQSAFVPSPSPTVDSSWNYRRFPPALLPLSAGIVLAIWVMIPMEEQTFAWDPRPHIDRAFIAQQSNRPGEALSALNNALAVSPRAVDLRRWKLQLLHAQGMPMAEEIRTILSINKSDARLYYDLAMQPSDLPQEERRKYLEHALWLDDQVDAEEVRRLPVASRQMAQAILNK